MLTGQISSLALLWISLRNRIPRLAVSLSNATLLALTKAKIRNLDLWQGDRNQVLAFSTDHLTMRNVLLEVLLDLALYDGPKPGMIPLNVIDHPDPFI
jgi:hypothetical protein